MNMKKLLLQTLLSFLALTISKAQNNIYSEFYNLNTGIAPENQMPGRTISYASDGVVYSVAKQPSTSGIKIYAYNINTKRITPIVIQRSKQLKKLFETQIDAIAVSGGKLVLIAFDQIYTFNYDGKSLTLRKVLPNAGNFMSLYALTSNQLLLYVNYQFHPLDEDHPHTWAKLYLDHDSIGKEYYFGAENLRFSSMPNQWISTYKGMIAEANTESYKINFYNSNFQIIDSIHTDMLKSNEQSIKYIPDGTEYSLDEIKRIGAADDSLLTRIEKIFLLDSNRLLVTLKQPNTHYIKYHIWAKIGDAWKLDRAQSLPGHYDNGANYNSGNNYVTGFYGNYSGLTYAGNNQFYFVYYPYIENPVSKSFDYQRDYYDVVNEMTKKKRLYYGIKKLQIISE